MEIYYQVPDGTRLYFYRGGKRTLQGFTKFAMPDITFIEDRGPNQHGTTVHDYRLQPRVITMDWFGRNCNGRQCEYADIVEAIRPTHEDYPGYLRVINQDTSLLEIPARIQTGPDGGWNIDSGLTPLQVRDVLQWYCPDPVWREVEQQTATATVEIADSCLDLCLPACLGTGILNTEIDVCYNGTWKGDQITFVLTGPLDTPTITNETTNQTIQLNYNIATNDEVTITILPETTTVTSLINGDIIGTVTSISDLVFFNLAARQTNEIVFSGANGIEGSTSISMNYYTRYLSVYDPCNGVC